MQCCYHGEIFTKLQNHCSCNLWLLTINSSTFLPSFASLLINEATIHLYTYCETRRERRALLSSLRKLRTTTVNTEMLSIKSEHTLSGFGSGIINMLSLLHVLWEQIRGESISFQLSVFQVRVSFRESALESL